MSLSQHEVKSAVKFFLDENVRVELFDFLKEKSYDVVQVRGLSNGKVSEISRIEKRVLVTNDLDFSNRELYPEGKIFSVVILRLPQARPDLLISSFSSLLDTKPFEFEGKIIVLRENGIEVLQ